jgi:hypothetical protein
VFLAIEASLPKCLYVHIADIVKPEKGERSRQKIDKLLSIE